MKVILLDKVENLGGLGDLVTVKPGYARNYLIPTRKAARFAARDSAPVLSLQCAGRLASAAPSLRPAPFAARGLAPRLPYRRLHGGRVHTSTLKRKGDKS